MSGGVDSSVAAAILLEQGHDVIGVTAIMTDEYSRCCAPEDVERAAQTAKELGFPHHVIDVRAPFKEAIIDYFMRDYLGARTPSPCAVCNPVIKFGFLLDEALKLGAERIATGHYVRIRNGANGVPRLFRGCDPGKDQSYFLARLSAAQLGRSLFPLGEMQKREVTRYADEHGLSCRQSRESQELCFVTEGTHGDWIDVRNFETKGPGDIVDTSGKTLGRHLGIHHYTVGQRKGLGIAVGSPVFVIAIDADRNRLVVGTRSEAMRQSLVAEDVSWISPLTGAQPFDATVQIRYRHPAAVCVVTPRADRSVECEFAEPQFAVAPGQLAAFYCGDEVLGGGWIK